MVQVVADLTAAVLHDALLVQLVGVSDVVLLPGWLSDVGSQAKTSTVQGGGHSPPRGRRS